MKATQLYRKQNRKNSVMSFNVRG